MDRKGVRDVLRLALGNGEPMTDLGEWVSLRCPLAPWTHASGKDSRPSFGVHVSPRDVSVVNCFTCGNAMPLHGWLAKYAQLSGKKHVLDLADEIAVSEHLGPKHIVGWDDARRAREDGISEEDLPPQPLEESVYGELYEPAAGMRYLRRRGISDDTADLLELKYDPGTESRDKEPRVLFPVRGPDGLLYGFSGRAVRDGVDIKVRDYYGLKKAKMLLGSHLVSQDERGYMLLAEGLFDYARGWEHGHPTCAIMHASPTDHQLALLRNAGRRIIVVLDDDDAGRRGTAHVCRQVSEYTPVYRTWYPRVWIEDEDEKGGGHWLKDLGETIKGELDGMVEAAKQYLPYSIYKERNKGGK